MKINILRTNPNAPLPIKKHEDDFCYDCFAVSEEEVHPNVWRYGLGISIQPSSEYDGSSIRGANFRARSSIWETGMILSNGQGTIDIDEYTGEIFMVFYHVITDLPRYKVGDKICQFCLERTESLEFNEVTELRKTKRGANGYGSTGK